MNLRGSIRDRASVVFAVAAAAAAYYSSTGLGTAWLLAWVAPLPILLLSFRSSWRVAALSAAAASFIGSLNFLAFAATFHAAGIPGVWGWVAAVTLTTLFAWPSAVGLSAAVLAARYSVRRLPAWLAGFVFPCAWTVYEFLCSDRTPNGTLLSLGYSQTDVLPILQIASLSGLLGVTFLVSMVPSALAVAWHRRAWSAIVPAAAITAAVVGFGVLRLRERPEGIGVRVGLAASDQDIEAAASTQVPAEALAAARAYGRRIERLADEDAQVIVLPEKFLGVTPADSTDVLQVFSDVARTRHVTVIAGLNRIAVDPPRNVGALFGPDGRVIVEYEKRHMVPIAEREFLGLRRNLMSRAGRNPTPYHVGEQPGIFDFSGVKLGVAICKDLDFPAWSRLYGQHDVRILFVPAWDFVVDARLHSRMAVVRGVENGFTIARSAQQGLLTFSDAYGRILAEVPSGTQPEALLVREIFPGPGTTFYSRHGDWLGWMSTVGLLAFLILSRARPQK
jgi:apolipoprotein N-acyltransferase